MKMRSDTGWVQSHNHWTRTIEFDGPLSNEELNHYMVRLSNGSIKRIKAETEDMKVISFQLAGTK